MRSWRPRGAGPGWATRPATSCGRICLTRLREAGMALEAVQAQAGHASIESTRIYLHLADDWLAAQYRKAAEVIDAQVFARTRRAGRWHRELAVSGPPAGRQRDGARRPAGRPGARRPADHGHDAPLPDPDRLRAAPGQASGGADLALRAFAGFLAETAPEVTSTAQVTRAHIEDYKPWLAARPGQKQAPPDHRDHRPPPRHAADVLRPPRRMGLGGSTAPGADVPRRPAPPGPPLPKALDDGAAARLLRAAQNDKRLLAAVTVEMLLRTGLRVGEYTSLRADAVVHIGACPWLHVPVGKLREDRYLPLHPNLVTLIDDYRARHVADSNPLLLPRENGKPADRHAVTRYINKAAATAGLGHIHPHQLRHTLATQAINRGMSLEAIAAMLGHRSLDMTLRYAKIASRTVADEYFAVTGKVEALYGQAPVLPADAIGPKMARLRREHHRMLGNGYCTRPAELDCAFESICETCTFFQTSIEFRPTLQAQHDDAIGRHQDHRGQLFASLLARVDQDAS